MHHFHRRCRAVSCRNIDLIQYAPEPSEQNSLIFISNSFYAHFHRSCRAVSCRNIDILFSMRQNQFVRLIRIRSFVSATPFVRTFIAVAARFSFQNIDILFSMRENQFVRLVGERVVLVPYERRHVPVYHEWMNRPELLEYDYYYYDSIDNTKVLTTI